MRRSSNLVSDPRGLAFQLLNYTYWLSRLALIKHPFIMRVFNEVGAIHLQNRELAQEPQWNFERVLGFLENGQHRDAIFTCKEMAISAM